MKDGANYLWTSVTKLQGLIFIRVKQMWRRWRQVLHRTTWRCRVTSGQFTLISVSACHGRRWRRKRRIKLTGCCDVAVKVTGRGGVFAHGRSGFGVAAVPHGGQVRRGTHQATWWGKREALVSNAVIIWISDSTGIVMVASRLVVEWFEFQTLSQIRTSIFSPVFKQWLENQTVLCLVLDRHLNTWPEFIYRFWYFKSK